MNGKVPVALFRLGRIMTTPGLIEAVPHEEIIRAIARHQSGDWGELDEHDTQANQMALEQGSRLLSAYTSASGCRFWIITEADRSQTTILLPHEY